MQFKKQVNDFDFGFDFEKVLPFCLFGFLIIVSLLRFAVALVVVVISVSVSWYSCCGGVCSGAQFCTLLVVEHQTVVTRSIST